jgi:hypothetical protein
MNPCHLLAEATMDGRLPYLHLILPVAAGVVAGLGAVGAFHFLTRPRTRVLALRQRPQAPAPDPFVHGSASEQRKSLRRQGNPVEVLITDPLSTTASPWTGYVVDRSVGGLCLLVEDPIPTNATLSVRPTNAPDMTPWVEVVVKACREVNPGHEVGCQFVKTPPWSVLLMFG